MSLASAGCLFWLEALRPFFAALAVGALAWQAWLVWRRPSARRSKTVWAIVAGTGAVNVLIAASWIAWQWRYR